MLQNIQSNTQLSVTDKNALLQTTLQTMQAQSAAELQAAQNSTTLTVADKQAAQSKYNADLAATNAQLLQGVDNSFKLATQTADTAAKVQLENLANAAKKEIANIQLTGNTVMQTSQNATSMFQTGMTMIQNVVADSTIPADSKTSLVNGYLQWMQQGINVIGNVNHVDVSDLLNFSTMTVN